MGGLVAECLHFPLHRLLQHRHHGQSGPAEPSSQKKHPETPCYGLMRHQKPEPDKFMEMLCDGVSPGIGDSQCPWLNLQQQVGWDMQCALVFCEQLMPIWSNCHE